MPGKRGHYKRGLTVEAKNVHPKYVVGGRNNVAVILVKSIAAQHLQ